MRKPIELKTVWDSDLEHLLGNLGMLELLLQGKVTCSQCGSTIDLDNVGAIIPQEDGAIIVCDSEACLTALTRSEVSSPHD